MMALKSLFSNNFLFLFVKKLDQIISGTRIKLYMQMEKGQESHLRGL